MQALRPFPQYSNIQNLYDLTGRSNYNALQLQAEKRFSNGLSYLSSLTLGRAVTNDDRSFAAFFNSPLTRPDAATASGQFFRRIVYCVD